MEKISVMGGNGTDRSSEASNQKKKEKKCQLTRTSHDDEIEGGWTSIVLSTFSPKKSRPFASCRATAKKAFLRLPFDVKMAAILTSPIAIDLNDPSWKRTADADAGINFRFTSNIKRTSKASEPESEGEG